MDKRDRYLKKHHQRRLAVASSFSLLRQILDAERHIALAEQQDRLAYTLTLRLWLGQLREQLNAFPVGSLVVCVQECGGPVKFRPNKLYEVLPSTHTYINQHPEYFITYPPFKEI